MLYIRLQKILLNLPRFAKQSIVVCVDLFLCVFSSWIALSLKVDALASIEFDLAYLSVLSILVALPTFHQCGLYNSLHRFFDLKALPDLLKALFVYGAMFSFLVSWGLVHKVPVTLGFIQPMVLFLGMLGSRVLVKLFFQKKVSPSDNESRILIYGAGAAGRQLAAAINSSRNMTLCGFIDDEASLQWRKLEGQSIYSCSEIRTLISRQSVTHIFLAMPSVSLHRRTKIVRSLSEFKIIVRTLPGISELAEGRVGVSHVRELDAEELLDRTPVQPDEVALREKVVGKTIIITGAGGSVGSELCVQVVQRSAFRLIHIDTNEHALYQVHNKLMAMVVDVECSGFPQLIPLLCSVQDEKRVTSIIRTWKPDIIFHAAAYKHVPIVEQNLSEGLKNNVFGTWTLANAAAALKVKEFVLISTDKAVRPTNVMGATKRLAEMTVQVMQDRTDSTTCFSMVRFGNVIESSGSVIPRFKEQILAGGPVSVTHPEVTRFFMTITEAAQLVIHASAMATGGEVFVLDMGKPVKILDLAKRIISLSGLTIKDEENPNGDIEIKITGLRPGEKLFEELLIGGDPQPTTHPLIMHANENYLPWEKLQTVLEVLKTAADANDVQLIRNIIKDVIDGYKPTPQPVDLIFLEQSVAKNFKIALAK